MQINIYYRKYILYKICKLTFTTENIFYTEYTN